MVRECRQKCFPKSHLRKFSFDFENVAILENSDFRRIHLTEACRPNLVLRSIQTGQNLLKRCLHLVYERMWAVRAYCRNRSPVKFKKSVPKMSKNRENRSSKNDISEISTTLNNSRCPKIPNSRQPMTAVRVYGAPGTWEAFGCKIPCEEFKISLSKIGLILKIVPL